MRKFETKIAKMTERQNLYGTLKSMSKGETISLPWLRHDKAGFKADYVRSAASRIVSDYGYTFRISATKEDINITVTRIS